jgi:hypothetical protein
LNVGEDYDYFYQNTVYDEAYYVDESRGSGLLRGRVEICDGDTQEWGTICDVSWSNLDASVVCQQLGYSRYGRQWGWGWGHTTCAYLEGSSRKSDA